MLINTRVQSMSQKKFVDCKYPYNFVCFVSLYHFLCSLQYSLLVVTVNRCGPMSYVCSTCPSVQMTTSILMSYVICSRKSVIKHTASILAGTNATCESPPSCETVTAYCVMFRFGTPVRSGGGAFHCSVIDVSFIPAMIGDCTSFELQITKISA